MKSEERQFKGVWIPAHIYLDDELRPLEKLLWADIDSFTASDSGYFKSNEKIAKDMGVSVRTAQRMIGSLKDKGYIKTIVKVGGFRVCQSCHPPHDKIDIPPTTMVSSPHDRVVTGEATKLSPIDTNRDTTKKNTIGEQEVRLPWYTANFGWAWEEWVREKKDRREKFTPRAQKMALNRLVELSGDNEAKAIEIINQSLANSWKGFFPLKKDKNGFNSENFTPDGIKSFIAEG